MATIYAGDHNGLALWWHNYMAYIRSTYDIYGDYKSTSSSAEHINNILMIIGRDLDLNWSGKVEKGDYSDGGYLKIHFIDETATSAFLLRFA